MNELLEKIALGERPSLNIFIKEWGEFFPLLLKLVETEQDPQWHAEGNVYNHTSMVLQELYKILEEEATHLSEEKKLALILSAVFHDIAKPITTQHRETKGEMRVVSPRHADKGRSYLAYRLLQLDLPYSLMKTVLALVGHHHDPKFLVIKEKRLPEWKRLARLADLELLYYLEKADIRGRKANDLEEQMEYIELFRLFAEEKELFTEQDPYESWRKKIQAELASFPSETQNMVTASAIQEYEKGKIYTPEEAIARSYRYRDKFARLTLLCGSSGAGKTTWIAHNASNENIISLDDIREEMTGERSNQSKNGQVLQKVQEMIKQNLREKNSVLIDATSLRKDFRQRILRLGYDYQALVTLVCIQLSPSELWRRNQKRKNPVPEKILHSQLNSLEWPYQGEAHRTIVVGAKGEKLADSWG